MRLILLAIIIGQQLLLRNIIGGHLLSIQFATSVRSN